jgi:hypothetical protein
MRFETGTRGIKQLPNRVTFRYVSSSSYGTHVSSSSYDMHVSSSSYDMHE